MASYIWFVSCFFKLFFWCAPFGYLYFLSFLILNEPGLGAGIDPGMALTPLPSSIGWGSIPQPSNCEPSTLPLALDHSFRFLWFVSLYNNFYSFCDPQCMTKIIGFDCSRTWEKPFGEIDSCSQSYKNFFFVIFWFFLLLSLHVCYVEKKLIDNKMT